MKRFLLQVALVALSAGLLLWLQPNQHVVLVNATTKPATKAQSKPQPTVRPITKTIVKTTPKLAVNTKPVFDANNPSTWPTCSTGYIVWASDGQCHHVVPPTPAVEPSITPAVAVQPSSVSSCGDNWYAHQIYMMESSCQLIDPNSEGCDGIGQACPESKIYSACPNMDYACQNDYFTQYAISRYGSWSAAYSFHIANGWW